MSLSHSKYLPCGLHDLCVFVMLLSDCGRNRVCEQAEYGQSAALRPAPPPDALIIEVLF